MSCCSQESSVVQIDFRLWEIPNLKRDRRSGFSHPDLLVCSLTGEKYFCSSPHCVGECGLPGLFLRHNGQEYKALGSIISIGPVWQRKDWIGDKVYVDQGLCASPSNELIELWWF